MFHAPNFDCICMAWKLWVTRLVPSSGQGEDRTKRDRTRKCNSHTSLNPGEHMDKPNSKLNRNSWHVPTWSNNSGLTFDETSLEGFPGEPHSGSSGVPHGDYRKSWHVSSSSCASSAANQPVIHQSSCPSSFYRQDKPKRDFKLPLRTESCPNSSHHQSVLLESRPQNVSFEQHSALEIGANDRKNDKMQCRRNRQDLLSKSGKQEAFDEDDMTAGNDSMANDINTNNTGDIAKEVDASTYASLFNNNGACSKGGRTMKCKDCGGRIVVSITTPTPTSSTPRTYRLKR